MQVSETPKDHKVINVPEQLRSMTEFTRNVIFASRGLKKSPAFALSSLAILTLGIGANTAIFGIVNTILLNPLPFPDSGSIVTIFHVPPAKAFPGIKTFSVSAANYLDWRQQSTVFEALTVIGGGLFRLTGGDRPELIRGARTDSDFFRVLDASPVFGRAYSSEETRPGRDDVVVVSYGFAQSHFGSASAAVGKPIQLNARNYRVIGVMPRAFQVQAWFPTSVDLWVPLAWTPAEAGTRGNHNYLVAARLRRGVTIAQTQSEMNVISDRLARDYPEEDKGWGAIVFSLREFLVGDVRPALLTLLGAVAFVLLIACANTANLVLARTVTRRKELAIRSALGASRSQVLRPVLFETTLLSVTGGALGLLLARSLQSLVIRALGDQMPRSVEIHLDARVLTFTFIASVFTGLASGFVAGWRLVKIDLNEALKQGSGKTDADAGGKRTRAVLVTAEVALALMLLIAAGALVRSLWALYRVDAGLSPTNVITMTVPQPPASKDTQRSRFYDELLARIRALPGVVAAATIDTLPLSGGGSNQPIVIEGHPAEVFALQPNVSVRVTTPDYLRTMKIPLIAGRDFEPADTSGQKDVVLISQSMAKQFFPGENPIGRHLRISFSPDRLREVIGVVGDVKERGLDVLEPISMLYEPLRADQRGAFSLVIRASGNTAGLASAVAETLRLMNPEIAVRDVRSMDQIVAISLSRQRSSMYLFAALAGLALLLAMIGIYSVLAYSVRSRLREIGIRLALGAGIGDVLRMIVAEGMKPVLAGILVGVWGAWAVSGILAKLVYGVSSTDPLTYLTVVGLLALVAFLSCLIPGYRATRVEPMQALHID